MQSNAQINAIDKSFKFNVCISGTTNSTKNGLENKVKEITT